MIHVDTSSTLFWIAAALALWAGLATLWSILFTGGEASRKEEAAEAARQAAIAEQQDPAYWDGVAHALDHGEIVVMRKRQDGGEWK